MAKQDREVKKMGEIIAKAWSDSAFKERLLKHTKTVLEEEGVAVPPGKEVRAIEDTDSLVHFVIPAKPPAVQGGKPLPVGQSALGCSCWQGEAWN
jgi:nitrile hydratase alpha subunit